MGKKEEHESFVQNLTGSSSFAVFNVIICIAFFIFFDGFVRFFRFFRFYRIRKIQPNRQNTKNERWRGFFIDVAFLVFPMIFFVTIFSEFLLFVFVTNIVFIFGLIFYISSFLKLDSGKKLQKNGDLRETSETSATSTTKSSVEHVVVSQYRGTILLLTAITILAVDFRVFPRWMAKTETAGFSVMDIGVGAFVIGNAMVAPQAKESEKSSLRLVWKEVGDSVLLIVLGAGRFVSVMLTDYQAPEAEYGKHWNFFCTLAFVKIFGRLAAFFVHPRHLYVFGACLLAVYELILQNGLYEFVLTPSEISENKQSGMTLTSFVLDNKSGLSSCVGFLALFLLWTYFARELRTQRKMKDLLIYGLQLGICSFAVMLSLELFPLPSRRLANASYVLWTTYLALAFLSSLILIRLFLIALDAFVKSVKSERQIGEIPDNSRNSRQSFLTFLRSGFAGDEFTDAAVFSPDLLFAINFNAMPFFLIANLLTGMINLSMDTMQFTYFSGFLVLCSYALVLVSFTSFLYWLHVKIPLEIPNFSKMSKFFSK